jgi:Xaa-Pro aminopeptidase
LNDRLVDLCERMGEVGMDAALLLHPRDILYYAGTVRPASLLVAAGASPREAMLFVRRGLAEAREEARIEQVRPMGGFRTIKEALDELGLPPGKLGLELDTTSAAIYERAAAAFCAWEMVDITPLVLEQRMVKEEREIAATRCAAGVADAGHRALAEALEPGLEELALAADVEKAMRLAGHEGFQPLRHPEGRGGGAFLMSGPHLTVRGGHGLIVTGAGLSAGSPYGASRRVVREGDIVVLDTGTTTNGYTADVSRTYAVGEPSPVHRELFETVRRTEEAVLEAIRPGLPASAVYETAETVVEKAAGPAFERGSLALPGFVGHGIGLELDEPPVLWPREKGALRRGMVLAVEIEVSAPDQGLMAKLEDTVVVRTDGVEVLTHAPRRLTV